MPLRPPSDLRLPGCSTPSIGAPETRAKTCTIKRITGACDALRFRLSVSEVHVDADLVPIDCTPGTLQMKSVLTSSPASAKPLQTHNTWLKEQEKPREPSCCRGIARTHRTHVASPSNPNTNPTPSSQNRTSLKP